MTRKSSTDGVSNDGILPLMVASAPSLYDQETDSEDDVDEVGVRPTTAKPTKLK